MTCYLLSIVSHVVFFPAVLDKQKSPPDSTGIKKFLNSCHPTLFARQMHSQNQPCVVDFTALKQRFGVDMVTGRI